MLSHSNSSLNSAESTLNKQEPAVAYARARRWLGISYVGTIVTTCSLLLIFSLPQKLFASSQNLQTIALDLVFAILVFSLCSLPFDIAGYKIECYFDRSKQSFSAFLSDLLRASLAHGVVLLAMALAVAGAYHYGSLAGLLSVSITISLVLICTQFHFARLYGGSNFSVQRLPKNFVPGSKFAVKMPVILLVQVAERCFSGGIVGWPGSESIVIPKRWTSEFSEDELSVELLRRSSIIASGGRLRGILLAIGFTNLGILFAALLARFAFLLAPDSTAGLIVFSCLFTLWSFVGLLVMPYFSHIGVYEADNLALASGVSKELLLATVSKIDSDLEGEAVRSVTVDTIFHPVPTIDFRLRALEHAEGQSPKGAWQTARYAVFLSVVGVGLLGRAVHCNAGKPSLWAILPAD
ncbi:hypothetical protein BH11CYA1_BH11CYA1_07430 [soil metagenome]